MRDVVRYGEAFKLRLVEDAAAGKYTSLEEARRRNGIRGAATLTKWLRKYGREDILPKRMSLRRAELCSILSFAFVRTEARSIGSLLYRLV
ncbi:MAG: hypothetical protein LBO65_03995 [Spirochaetaceae bacterium]|jgi:transposase-like protein|nr:hypothetical protein [Spirochaetaceae bacterium]